MNFLFDLIASQPNNDGEFHGGGKYAKKIFFALFKENINSVKAFALFDSSRTLDSEIKNFVDQQKVQLIDVQKITPLRAIIEENSIDRLYSALPFGLIRFGLFDSFVTKCKVYCTIHGLRNLEVKMDLEALNYYSNKDLRGKLRAFTKSILPNQVVKRDVSRYHKLFQNTVVFTVSKHTKFSILSYFPGMNNDVEIFYSPDVTEFEDVARDLKADEFALDGYFLLISGNRWLKNNLRSAIALDKLFSERTEIRRKVVITGVSHPEIFLSRIVNKDRFIFYQYVSEVFLRKLYQRAFAFIYMTLNEGFGYPPLDAMKAGIPVITSPFTSITEICGDAVLYANPYSVDEIKNRILQLNDSEIYTGLANAGILRYQKIRNVQDKDLERMSSRLLN